MKHMIKESTAKPLNLMKNILNIISANITSSSKDGKKLNAQSLSSSEVRDILSIHQYGLASFPYDGIPIIIMNADGEYIMLGSKDKGAPSLKYGEACLYTKFENYVLLKDNGDIEIKNSGCNINITNGDIAFSTPTKTTSINAICTALGI